VQPWRRLSRALTGTSGRLGSASRKHQTCAPAVCTQVFASGVQIGGYVRASTMDRSHTK
jgi:hypothetical protein